jgi:MYXO-CTERM domain-containing protein
MAMNRSISVLAALAVTLALAGCQDGPTILAAPTAVASALESGSREPWEPGVVLVKWRPEFSAGADDAARELGLVRGKPRGRVGVDHMRLQTKESVPEAVARIAKDPRVLYAEPNHRIALLNTPNDPRLGECWGLHNTGQTGGTPDADIDALEAWDISIGSFDVVVAVVDTGVDYNHPDLAANIWVNPGEIPGNGIDDDGNGYVDDVRGYDFTYGNDSDPMDDHSHGTHCAGTIGAVGNNALGVVGVNWRVKIMPVRIIASQELDAFCLDAAEGIRYAVENGARVLSNSWWTVRTYNQTLHDTVLWTVGTDAILVFAAGNYEEDVDDPANAVYPASWHTPNMIGVAATNHRDERVSLANTGGWWGSNFGATTVDVGAPGEDVLSTVPGGGYELKSGTSMACPHVAGAVALMLSIRPELDAAGIKAALFGSVDPLSTLQGITTTGGRINLHRAMQVISGLPLPPVALAGGDQKVLTGSVVALDGSRSFDPNQDPITFDWEFFPPGHSAASLDDPTLPAPGFTADVCGLFQARLTVMDDGGLRSQPDRARVHVLNVNPLSPVIESPHPYPDNFDQTWVITQPGAVIMSVHFSLFDTEAGWDYVYVLDGEGNQVARYDGAKQPFDSPVVEGDTLQIRFTTDGSVTRQGFVIDQVWWCDAGACPPGLGDCNDDPADGCETDTSQDVLNCGWCGRSCARPNAQFACQASQCVFLDCDPGFADCDALLANGCESDPLVDPAHCGGCGNACPAMPNALPGCAAGQCAIVECLPGWGDCNGIMDDGCERDLTADTANCGLCALDCLALPGVDHAYCDAGLCWLGNCAADPQRVECPHPYTNYFDQTWTLSRPGATRIRVHFEYVDVEPNYDYVYLMDAADQVIETYNSYNMPPFWSAWVTGDTLRVRLRTDVSVTARGFVVDQVASCGEGACLEGFEDCDGLGSTGCEVEVATDPENCGGCGLVCAARPHVVPGCEASGCVELGCEPGWGDCNPDPVDGCEQDLLADVAHCGTCGNACAFEHAGAACQAGACVLGACESGYDDCDQEPANGCEVELGVDPAHCGTCGNACAFEHAEARCQAGACLMGACEEGHADCDQEPANGCEVELGVDLAHCGACGNACAFEQAEARCEAGACLLGACVEGHDDCDQEPANGCEVELGVDLAHCGACGNACAFEHAEARCEAGACLLGACVEGYDDCDQEPANGCEAELGVDLAHCGACGNACAAGQICAAGRCELGDCPAGYDDCDQDPANGCEVELAVDPAHCGACGNACAAGWTCEGGLCQDPNCPAGFGDCDEDPQNGCEQSLTSDPAHCGACGRACSFPHAGASCQAGQCRLGACDQGFDNCDQVPENGCEVELATDVLNCGACGHACQTGQTCVAGQCQAGGCPDQDEDGYADRVCGGNDCDDQDPAVNPGAVEVCGNARDDNCDGQTDEGCDEATEGGGCGCAAGGDSTPDASVLLTLLGLLGLSLIRRRR